MTAACGRPLLGVCAGMIAAAAVIAQPADKPRVIGLLALGPGLSAATESLQRGLRERGWIEGKNLRVEYRFAANRPERLPAFADELVRHGVELIVASGTPAVQAAKNATSSIPIVMGSAADAEGSGFVASLARPGGNITGVSMMLAELAGKRLEILKELNPKLARVAYLAYEPDPAHKLFLKQTMDAGQALNLRIQPVRVSSPGELSAAFALMVKERADAVVVQPLFSNNLGLAPSVAGLTVAHRLANISDGAGYVEAGGLLFYGPDPQAIYPRIASFVDRILKGDKPAQIPVEQPQKFLFILNLVAAKKLGITVPRSLLARADRVIE